MGKRSNFDRVPRDYYPTPLEAVKPLVPHLPKKHFSFREPCAGDGRLIKHVESLTSGKCTHAADIEPRAEGIIQRDALQFGYRHKPPLVDVVCITNPPWDRKILHPLIEIWAEHMPTWLLFDADWMHTKQSGPYMKYCKRVVSVGRVKWIEGSKQTGKDNCCWYLFDKSLGTGGTLFYGR